MPPSEKKKFVIYIIDNRFFDFVHSEDPVNNVHIDWIFRIKKCKKSKIYNIDKKLFFITWGYLYSQKLSVLVHFENFGPPPTPPYSIFLGLQKPNSDSFGGGPKGHLNFFGGVNYTLDHQSTYQTLRKYHWGHLKNYFRPPID